MPLPFDFSPGCLLTQAEEHEVISWMSSSTSFIDCISYVLIHGLHCAILPPQDLLDGTRGRITLRPHWYKNVGSEHLSHANFVNNPLGDFLRNNVVSQGIGVVLPSVGRPKEILIFHVDEVFGLADLMDHTPVKDTFKDSIK